MTGAPPMTTELEKCCPHCGQIGCAWLIGATCDNPKPSIRGLSAAIASQTAQLAEAERIQAAKDKEYWRVVENAANLESDNARLTHALNTALEEGRAAMASLADEHEKLTVAEARSAVLAEVLQNAREAIAQMDLDDHAMHGFGDYKIDDGVRCFLDIIDAALASDEQAQRKTAEVETPAAHSSENTVQRQPRCEGGADK